MQTEPIGGHPTHVRRLGTGARPVLALHCSLAHGGAWGAIAAELGDALTLTAPDLPGHGHSATWPEPPGLHDTATAIATDLAARIGGGAPVDVFGHSFGGTVALRLALEHPDLVRSLTLFEPVLFSAARVAMTPAARDWLQREAAFEARLAAGERRAAAAEFHALWGNGIALERLPLAQQNYILDRIHAIPAAVDVVGHDRPGLLAPGRLESLQMPILLAEGARSPAVIAAINDALMQRLPHAQRLVLPGAGHMLPLSHATALAPAIRAHLDQAAAEAG